MTERNDLPNIDPALLRGLTQRRMSRRDLLKYTGVGVGALGISAILAACGGGGGGGGGGGTSPSLNPADLFKGQPSGTLNFANWPLYIDKAKDAQGNTVHPSLDQFTKDTGIQVNYREVIQDNSSFFGKIQPQLQAGQDTGWDIIVITNGEFLDKLFLLNYLTPLDHALTPNFNKYAGPSVKDPSYDPGNKYTMAWQSGITGIGWDPKQVASLRPGNPKITSFKDLLDPAFKGKVGMFGIADDLASLAMVGLGILPETSTPDDWKKAADVLQKQKDDGIVRQYFTQNYINALSNGDVALTMAWSGDIYQTNAGGDATGLQFAVPTEGAVVWTDNMCIPQKAAHPVDAITYMDYVYQPRIAATIAEWVNYFTPVPAAQQVIQQDAAKASGADKTTFENLAKSPLIFPTPADNAKLHRYPVLTEEQRAEFNSIFQPIYQG